MSEPTVSKVVSRDGTEIAYWTSGGGPPLVLVHGTTADHTTWRALTPHLQPHVTVHAMDRRGRGASGEGAGYEAVREFEDVAAVVDAIAATSGSGVDVLGHSFGGFCALGAAKLTPNTRRLVIYEPPVGAASDTLPPGIIERLDALLGEGKREEVLETFLRDVVMMPDEDLNTLRSMPSWQARIAAALTIPRELRTELAGALDLEQAASITAPTLMVSGGDSSEAAKADTEAVAAALPDARILILDGQQHAAHQMIPDVFASHVVAFLRKDP